MKRTLVAALIGMMFTGANAASIDDINISGFGSFAVGKSNNNVGYSGYDDDNFDVFQDTLMGVQLDVQINDRAKFVGQIVANGRYDYDVSVEMAYFSYDFDAFTVRAGKLRAPLFMYSDYLDVGYAYPMLRPSVELYNNGNVQLPNYTGVELLIPIEFDDSSLLIQPIVGTSEIANRDTTLFDGVVTLNNFVGTTIHWYVDDYTFRGSYAQATTEVEIDDSSVAPSFAFLDNRKGQFASLGTQYDNGDFIGVVEAISTKLKGPGSDVESVFGLFGYRFGEVMPYVIANWIKTSDDEDREGFGGAFDGLNYKTTAYSLGARWDFASSLAFKADITYADFHGTPGDFSATEDDTIVYSAAVDFIF